MAAKRRPPIQNKDLKGLKYFKLLGSLLERLHDDATARDRAGNRRLFYDQYACLLLLFFFNPVVRSLRGIQQASELDKVQRLFGCHRVSRGALSEASRVFDPELLHALIGDIAAQTLPLVHGKEAEALRGLTAVDGSLLPALPKMAWALWLDPQHRAAKMHVHFDVLKGVPVETTVTAGNDSETRQLRATLQAQRLYVIDRGYADYQLFQDILDAQSGFIGRIRDNAVWTVVAERPLTAEARAAGVRSDRVVRLGGPQSGASLKQPVRVLEVETGKTDAHGRPEILLLATSRLDLAAELVALGYRFRWTVELFFRWLKCILGCRHLLADSREGVTIQVYLAIIASLLISLWVGRKPTIRTLEMIQFYFQGWATEEELMAHLHRLQPLAK
ncbi:MAG: IS4 family transposase [Tepidisphaerales bacterium]